MKHPAQKQKMQEQKPKKKQIIFCDINKRYIQHAEYWIRKSPELMPYVELGVYHGPVQEIAKGAKPGWAFVSPANSFGSMGGGIDKIYRAMWPGIDKTVMAKISKLPTRGECSRAFDKLKKADDVPLLPVGSALLTSLDEYRHYEGCYLITAPTMVTPENIARGDEQRNPFRAFNACLDLLFSDNSVNVLICPGLGTGVGGIIPEECVQQMFEALYLRFCLEWNYDD